MSALDLDAIEARIHAQIGFTVRESVAREVLLLIARVRELEATVARVEALAELDGGAFLKPNTKIKRVQEDRRHDLGAIVTTSMVTVQDILSALSEPTS